MQMVQLLWKSLAVCTKVKHTLTIVSRNTIPSYLRWNKPWMYLPKFGNNPISLSWEIDKQIVVCHYNELLLSSKKEWTIDLWKNIDWSIYPSIYTYKTYNAFGDFQLHYTKQKKLDSKGYIQYDSIQMLFWKWWNYGDRLVLFPLKGGGKFWLQRSGTMNFFFFLGNKIMEPFWFLIMVMVVKLHLSNLIKRCTR